jgi:UDP-N-acetylmuramate: L-alanyl-gamma-D-glutamyl-meso-diaminopimelate ligase
MRLGIHKDSLGKSLNVADEVILFQPKGLDWDMGNVLSALGEKASLSNDIDQLVASLAGSLNSGDHVLIMSNGGFGGIHEKLLSALESNEKNIQ